MRHRSSLLRPFAKGSYYGFQFVCYVLMGLLGVILAFGMLIQFGGGWQRAGGGLPNRIKSTDNLKAIGLAIHKYSDVRGAFPPAYRAGNDGKRLLSWRVLILPLLEHGTLYREFHRDEPWDSEHNKRLIDKMPDVYKSPSSKVSVAGKTNYLAVRGEKSVFPGGKGVTFQEITDGAANTIMTVEVSDDRAVIWTKPDDFQYDEQHPLEGLRMRGEEDAKVFLAGMADGSVQYLSAAIEPKTLNALFTQNGGEHVDVGRSSEKPSSP